MLRVTNIYIAYEERVGVVKTAPLFTWEVLQSLYSGSERAAKAYGSWYTAGTQSQLFSTNTAK